ncbi:hypothetical protein [uncultured Ruegeria sp.]|uniref:hypothetical protein n=1 Tax=uncultured Ruegeria sp. TaxID=259304 RepID=UPI00263A20CB|nr:hypothetical protein [uncultured Ruegeria sp.]
MTSRTFAASNIPPYLDFERSSCKAHSGQNSGFVPATEIADMALFSFRHSVKTFSPKRTAEARAAKHGQTAATLRFITRPTAARIVLRELLREKTDANPTQLQDLHDVWQDWPLIYDSASDNQRKRLAELGL